MKGSSAEIRKTHPTSLPEAFELGARSSATLTILDGDAEESRPYEELVSAGHRAATGLAERGVKRGDRVALYARSTFDFVVGSLAAWRLGAAIVPLPLPPRISAASSWKEQNAARIRESSPALILLGRGDPDPGTDVRSVEIEAAAGTGDPDAEGPDPDDLAVIQFTSGSTAAPRGIELSHRAATAQIQILGRRNFLEKREESPVPLPDGHRGLIWLPLYHDLGLFYLLTYMSHGRSLTLLPTASFLADPAVWLREIARRGITASTAPNFAYSLTARILERIPAGEFDLGGWRHAYTGGDPVDPNVLERFARAAARFGFTSDRLMPGYGLAEAACSVAGRYSGEGFRVDRVDRAALARGLAQRAAGKGESARLVGNGLPHPGVEVRIIDDRGEPLPERSIGEIEVLSPCAMRGYFRDSKATNAVLRNGWIRTGDRGYIADGEVFVTGRIKDIVIVHGQNYHAEDIERVAQDVVGVRPGSCVAYGSMMDGEEQLVILAERKEGSPAVDERIRTEMANRVWRVMGLRAKEVALFPPKTIPKTSSGKLQRRLARELFESGTISGESPR